MRGSATGEDGEGYSTNRFVSHSGRVVIEPDDWNLAYCVAVFKHALPENHTVTCGPPSGPDAEPQSTAPGVEACVTVWEACRRGITCSNCAERI